MSERVFEFDAGSKKADRLVFRDGETCALDNSCMQWHLSTVTKPGSCWKEVTEPAPVMAASEGKDEGGMYTDLEAVRAARAEGGEPIPLEQVASEEQLSPRFICPACGGEHFGRNTAGDIHGNVVCLETVRCHDQFEVGCAWRGAWPSKRYDEQMARRMSQIVSQSAELTKRAELAEAAAAKKHRLQDYEVAMLAAAERFVVAHNRAHRAAPAAEVGG